MHACHFLSLVYTAAFKSYSSFVSSHIPLLCHRWSFLFYLNRFLFLIKELIKKYSEFFFKKDLSLIKFSGYIGVIVVIFMQDMDPFSNAAVGGRERARLRELQRQKKQKIDEILAAQNAAIDEDMVDIILLKRNSMLLTASFKIVI